MTGTLLGARSGLAKAARLLSPGDDTDDFGENLLLERCQRVFEKDFEDALSPSLLKVEGVGKGFSTFSLSLLNLRKDDTGPDLGDFSLSRLIR
jgi:hypothetical protein